MLARFVAGRLKPARNRVLVVVPAVEPDAAALAEGFTKALPQGDNPLETVRIEIQSDTADVAKVVAAVKREGPGVVLAPMSAEGFGMLIEALRRAGEEVPLVGCSRSLSRVALPPIEVPIGDVYVPAHFAPDQDRKAVREFVSAYKERFGGSQPGAAAALAYDAVQLVDAALRKAMPGGVDEEGNPRFPTPEAVNEALRGLSLEEAVTGPLTIGADGSITKPLCILRVDSTGGHFHTAVAPRLSKK